MHLDRERIKSWKEFMKGTLNRKLHFSTLPECKSKPGYEGTSKAILKN